MPDRMYRLRTGDVLVYDVAFKRKREDRHAIPADAPSVHRIEVRVRKESGDPETLVVEAGGRERRVTLGDVLTPVYAAVRELAAEAGAPDLGDCALVFRLRT